MRAEAPPPSGFDRVAAAYRTLERLAFGGDLQRARCCFLPRLREARDILVLGEGDGRCLAQLVRAAPRARIRCVDASAAMIARARRRLGHGAAARVSFEQADATRLAIGGQYDAVLTLFFLDCFTAERVEALVARVRPCLRPRALWLFADFVLPPRGWRRLRARLWLWGLYAFFRWRAGIEARRLPPSERILERAGLRPVETAERQHGFVRSVLFEAL